VTGTGTRQRGTPDPGEVDRAWAAMASEGRLEVVASGGNAPAVLVDEARGRSADLVVMACGASAGSWACACGSTALGVLHDLDGAATALIPCRLRSGGAVQPVLRPARASAAKQVRRPPQLCCGRRWTGLGDQGRLGRPVGHPPMTGTRSAAAVSR
jgi:hypothetical protein